MSQNKKIVPYVTNMVNRTDPLNLNSISSNNSLITKFQICLGKLNDNSTKEVAFTEIKNMILKNYPSQNALRSYLSVLNSTTSQTNHMTASAKELHCLIYGFIASVYTFNLLDPLDHPPNLLKTIQRIINQIKTLYLNDTSNIIHRACAHSLCELLIRSMPKDNKDLIINTFFDPFINLISSGSAKQIQDGAAVCISELIDCLGKKECGDFDEILQDVSHKLINNLLKGPLVDNVYQIECLYKLMYYASFEQFILFLKELYDKLIQILKEKLFSFA